MATVPELLEQTWAGEALGAAYFAALERSLPDQAATWALLGRLERTTGTLVEPVARAHDVTIDEAAASGTGRQFGEAATDLGTVIDGSVAVAAQYLGIYQELGKALSPDDAWLGPELVAHERALVSCLEALRQGTDGSMDVRAFQQRHEK
jgi:hypothetical protein